MDYLRSRWELKNGHSYPAIPIIVFGKSRKNAVDSSAARARAARTALVETPTRRGGAVRVHFDAGGPMTNRTIHYVVAMAGKAAGIDFPVHPHMLRHATGFYLANAGEDTRAIQ